MKPIPVKQRIDEDGYVVIDLDEYGECYGHDIAFLLMTGQWPRSPVVHLNGNRRDNAWINLQERDHLEHATRLQTRSSRLPGPK